MQYRFTKLEFRPSSNIKEAYWDSYNKVLKLVFHNNWEYLYYNMDPTVILEWFKSDSVGEYFYKHIKNNKEIKFERIL